VSNLLTSLLTGSALPACFLNPFLIVRIVAPRRSSVSTFLWTAVVSLVVNMVVPLGLHLAGVAIFPLSLAFPHWVLTIVLVPAWLWRCRGRLIPSCRCENATLLLAPWIGLCLLVMPFTHLAGIDTYKWLDLASNVGVQESIPWLVHPASLLGFTPRSYPSLQPLLLGSVQIIGGLGVDWSYYVVSVVCAGTALLTSFRLGCACLDQPRQAGLFAFLYAFSPVFVRYTHWATGRGFFLALFPLYLAGAAELPKPRAWLPFFAGILLLPLAHKVGLVAVLLVPLALGASLLLPRTERRALRVVGLLCAGIVALGVAPTRLAPFPIGNAVGALRAAVTRFAWMLPVAAFGLVVEPWFTVPARRRLWLMGLATLPAAFHHEMYGALLSLPFMVLAATIGLVAMVERLPRWAPHLHRLAIALTLAGALVIVGHRSATATPRRIRAVARFLDEHDPEGPFRILAPGDARQQIQGYVSGCPRFAIYRTGTPRLRINPPPALDGSPRSWIAPWIAYTRHMFSITGVHCELYGMNPRFYYVVIDGNGARPRTGELLYDENGVRLYGPSHWRNKTDFETLNPRPASCLSSL